MTGVKGPGAIAWRHLAAVPAVIALVLMSASCGGGDDTTVDLSPRVPTASFAADIQGPERAPAMAAQTYVIARNTGDGATICALTSFNEKDLDRCKSEINDTFQSFTQVSYRLKSVRLKDTNDADVLLLQTKPKQKSSDTLTQFTMEKVDGEWKVRTVGFAAS